MNFDIKVAEVVIVRYGADARNTVTAASDYMSGQQVSWRVLTARPSGAQSPL